MSKFTTDKLEKLLVGARASFDVYTAAELATAIELVKGAQPENAATEHAHCREVAEQFGIERTLDLADLLCVERGAARATAVRGFYPEAVRALLVAVKKRIGTHPANAALRPLVKAVEDSERK